MRGPRRAFVRSLIEWMLVIASTAAAGVACRSGGAAPMKELQRVHSGNVDIALLSESDALKQGKGSFVLEFRGPGGQLVDVGTVNIDATMPMAGMAPMFGETVVKASETTGRYEVTSDFGMAGTWRMDVRWNGPAGSGMTSLRGTVL